MKEEIGIDVISEKLLIQLQHDYSDRILRLRFRNYRIHWHSTKFARSRMWVGENFRFKNYAFPSANKVILNVLKLPNYYAILNDDSGDLLLKLNHLLSQNIKLIQVRFKNLSESQLHEFLSVALPLCQKNEAVLLINSTVKNAFKMLSNGVHLTSFDLLNLEKRPENLNWLSASCHNLEELKHAEKIGIDFVVIAPVLKTSTHPETNPLGWDSFTNLLSVCNLPVYALGGLKQSDLEKVQNLGAQGIAGISTFLEMNK